MEKKMNIFKLEDYLEQYEFSARYLLCCSDVETVEMQELLSCASPEQMKLWQQLKLGYTEIKGLPALRTAVAQQLYPHLEQDNILMFAGAEEAIFCTLFALVEPTDHVIVLTPCYQSLYEIPKMKGAEITKLELKEDNGWRINLNAIQSALKKNTRFIIINFPHNPTGQVIEQHELEQLIDICRSKGIWLFSDEVYHSLGVPDNSWTLPAASLYEKAISVNVMSKAFGMAGLRVGWIACQDKTVLKKITHTKHYTSICNSAPSEILTLIALSNKEKILQRNNAIVAKNLQILDQFFIEYKHLFEWVRPQGGCIGFVKYKGPESIDLLCDQLVRQKSVLLMPAALYNSQGNYFRIGFGRKDMPEALSHFKDFLKTI